MPQGGTKSATTRINGQIIVNEIVRNMEVGKLDLRYSVLLPCIFSIYLHPDDYARLSAVHEIIVEDARRALNALLVERNAKGGLLRRAAKAKQYRIAQSDWVIEFCEDTEGAVPPGDVEIHSELNDAAQPGHRGAKTTLIGRPPSVTSSRIGRVREGTRLMADRVLAEFRYRDDSGAQSYLMTQNEIAIGRGGEDQWVDVALETTDEISREHARVRRDPETGAFTITDCSRNGTWVNGRRLKRDVECPLPERAEIGLAEVVKLQFEARHA